MKKRILELYAKGKSYNKIKEIVGCSKGTISFHCGDGQKEKNRQRQRKNRAKNILSDKIDRFKNSETRKLSCAVRDFQRKREKSKVAKRPEKMMFTKEDVLNKFGTITKCYLSGTTINLLEQKDYQLDHIVPVIRGGENSISNLGIVRKDINRMKGTLMVKEFLLLCKQILENNGYKVEKITGEVA